MSELVHEAELNRLKQFINADRIPSPRGPRESFSAAVCRVTSSSFKDAAVKQLLM